MCIGEYRAVLREVRSDFNKSEEGSLTIFSLFLFVLILMIAGTAVDLINHESNRVELQNTLDTAVLAAASSTQQSDRNTVIRDYVEKAGFDSSVLVLNTANQSGASLAGVSSPMFTDTIFMNMMGIDSLLSNASAQASEQLTAIEISLVLDFTSSMRGARRAALVDAVKDFVNVVFDLQCDSNGDNCVAPTNPPNITVNVVPYGGTVNPGPQMAAMMGLQRWHNYSSCGVIPTSAYQDTQLPYGTRMQYPHYYIWWRQIPGQNQEFGWCPQDTNTIRYAETDPEAIKTYVSNLNLNDGTGSDIGFKWGMALLDPSSRDEMNVITSNPVGVFPQDDAPNVLKVAVLMTDGGITEQRLPTEFAFEHLYDENVDLRAPNLANDDPDLDFSLPFSAQREAIYDRRGSEDTAAQPRDRSVVEINIPGTSATRTGSMMNSIDDAIDNLTAQCQLAEAQVADLTGTKNAVTVYTVRFLEDRQWTEDYLMPCAESENHYFDVQTVGALDNAFTSIGQHINNQRLTLTN